ELLAEEITNVLEKIGPKRFSATVMDSGANIKATQLIFEDDTAVDVEAVAVVDDISGTVSDVEMTAAIDDVGSTFDIEVAAAVDDINDIGSFAAIVVSDIINVFDVVDVASFDDVSVGAFDNVSVSTFENTADLMFLR
ncbi:37141_t:CDS:2, partial [Gigaspora margarita]